MASARTSARARAPTTSEPVVLSPPSYAAASGASVEFGTVSPVGAHNPALRNPEYAPDAFAAARARASATALANATPSPPPRQVPKRLREANTVEALTGLIHELPVPSAVPVEQRIAHPGLNSHGHVLVQDARTGADAASGGGVNAIESAVVDRFSILEVQKRRRRCDGERSENTHATTPSGVGDDMTDDLCFLVDKVAIKDAKADQKFMPYIV